MVYLLLTYETVDILNSQFKFCSATNPRKRVNENYTFSLWPEFLHDILRDLVLGLNILSNINVN